MAREHNFLGISYLGLGAPGDGIMGATLAEFKDFEVGSASIEGSTPNETIIPTEGNDTYLAVNDTATAHIFKIRLYGVTPVEKVLLSGGAVVGDFWEAPVKIPNIYRSLRIKGEDIDGKRAVIEVPYGKISAREQGTITKNGLPAYDITVTAVTPVSQAGVKGPPIRIGTEAA